MPLEAEMSRERNQLEAVLQTERLALEPLRTSHAAELFEILADERLYRFIPHDPPASKDALATRFQRLEGHCSPRGDEVWLNWVIRLRSAGCCVGRVEATLREDGSAFLAYEIGAAYWRLGLATEACRRVIEALFADFAAQRIMADVDTRNATSIRLLERLGFERGAVTLGADCFKGSVSDEVRYTLHSPSQTDGAA